MFFIEAYCIVSHCYEVKSRLVHVRSTQLLIAAFIAMISGFGSFVMGH